MSFVISTVPPRIAARWWSGFRRNAAIPVFLISLKAGGVGLNLTGADTVIHFDPWWNPAVEDQATDRAHRIGQTKVVTSYKLITRDTVEEKILHPAKPQARNHPGHARRRRGICRVAELGGNPGTFGLKTNSANNHAMHKYEHRFQSRWGKKWRKLSQRVKGRKVINCL